MANYLCQNCGKPAIAGHNCNGKVFVASQVGKSIEATGERISLLEKKGFHKTDHARGVLYCHPMCGMLSIHAGEIFELAFGEEKEMSLDSYLDSLPNSRYIVVSPEQVSCALCGGIGTLIPSRFPFSHEANCGQARWEARKH